ncbi:MAG: universal stress protein [Bacteroidetes bacterium]|nr:universal stress protein [Bacteroidota bacterium]
MKTIIVATDFSAASGNAVNYAADMAVALHVPLMLFHVYAVPVGYAEIPVPVNIDEIQHIADAEMNKHLRILQEQKGNNLNIQSRVVTGAFFTELKNLCEEIKPMVVVLGSQGTTSTERFLFGSHTIHAIKHLQWPVISVPKGRSFTAIKKIGMASTLENITGRIPVSEIKEFVESFKASFHVINIGKEDNFNPDIPFGAETLKEMMAPVVPEYHFIGSEDTDNAIMNFADEEKLDLLIILPKHHSFIDNLVHTSHTKNFVLHAHVPLLALHKQ